MELVHHVSAVEETRPEPLEEIERRYVRTIGSPIGPITLIANDKALLFLTWGPNPPASMAHVALSKAWESNSIIESTTIQLREYFVGKRTVFDVPISPKGTTFQMQVWAQLLKIPYGRFITYGEQARLLGRLNSARAVGAANGKNPIGIIIPCHRVIGASGDLTGFAGGIDMKKQLLVLEGVHFDEPFASYPISSPAEGSGRTA